MVVQIVDPNVMIRETCGRKKAGVLYRRLDEEEPDSVWPTAAFERLFKQKPNDETSSDSK